MRTISKHRPLIVSPSHDGDLMPNRKKIHSSKTSLDMKPYRKVSSHLDEYQLKASKILQVNNLDASVSEEDLLRKFSKFGDIIDVEICPSLTKPDQCEALVQFCDIKSVVHVLNYAGDIVIHGRVVELCFGKSQPTNCLWLDKLPERTTEGLLNQHFHQFGKVMDVVLDHAFMRALVYFESSSIAQKALKFTKEQYFNGEKVHVDYASYQCQTLFKSRVPVAYSWNNCDTSLEREQPSESISEIIFSNASVDTRSSWQSPSSIKSPSEGICLSPIPKLSDSTASPDLSDNLLHETADVLSTSSHNQLSYRHLPLSSSTHNPLCYSSASSSSSARHNRHHTSYTMYDSTTSSKENITKKSSSALYQEQHLRSLKTPLSVNTNVSCGGYENVSSRGFTSPGDESCPSITASPSRSTFHHSQSSQQRSKKPPPIPDQSSRHLLELSMLTESNSSVSSHKDRVSSSKRNASKSSHFTSNYSGGDENRGNSTFTFSVNESMYDKIKRRNSKASGCSGYEMVAPGPPDSISTGSERFSLSSPLQNSSHVKRHKSSKDSFSSSHRSSHDSSMKKGSSDVPRMKHSKHQQSLPNEEPILASPPPTSSLKKGFLTVNSVFCTTPSTTDDEENYDRDNAYYYDVPTPSTIHMEGDPADDLPEEELEEKLWHASSSDKRNISHSEGNVLSNDKGKDCQAPFCHLSEHPSPPKKSDVRSDSEFSPKATPREFPPVAVVSPQRKLSIWTTESFEILPAKPNSIMASSPKELPLEKGVSISDSFLTKSNMSDELSVECPNLKPETESPKSDSCTSMKLVPMEKETIPFAVSMEDKLSDRSHILSQPSVLPFVSCPSSQMPCIPGVNVFSPITAGDVKSSTCPATSSLSNSDNGSCAGSLSGDLIMSTLRPAPVPSSDSSLHNTESNSSESAPDISSDICTLIPPPSKRSKLSPALPSISNDSALRLEETIDSIVKSFVEPISTEHSVVDDLEGISKPHGTEDPYALEFMDSPNAKLYPHQSPELVTTSLASLVTMPTAPASSIHSSTTTSVSNTRPTTSVTKGHKTTTSRRAHTQNCALSTASAKSTLDEATAASISDIIDNVAHGNFDMDWHLNLWRQQHSNKQEECSHPEEKPASKKEWPSPAAAISSEADTTLTSYPQVTAMKDVPVHVTHSSSHNLHEQLSISDSLCPRGLMTLPPAVMQNSSPSPMSIPSFPLSADSTLKFGTSLLSNVTPSLIPPTISPPVVQLTSSYPFHDIPTASLPYPVFYQSNELMEALYPFNLPMVPNMSATTSTSNMATDMASTAAAYGSCGLVTPLLTPLMEDLFSDQNKLAAILSMYKMKTKHPPRSTPSTTTSITSSTPPSASCEIPEQYNSIFSTESDIFMEGHAIDPEYPLVWQGRLSLKNDDIAVNMHHVHGNVNLIDACLLLSGCVLTGKDSENKTVSGPPLKIVQRMRLEASQLEAVGKKMRIEPDHCSCVAVAHGSTIMEKLQTKFLLLNSFIKYMQEKSAAGIINVCHPNSHQGLYVIHIFPPCEFSNTHLYEVAPKLQDQLTKEKIPHLLVVITTA